MPVSTVSTSRAVRYVARRGTSVSGVSDLPVASERPARLDVGIVGTGRVGAVLGAALQKAGHRLVAVSGVSELSRERAAAASVTAVPRSLASALSPLAAGWMLDRSTYGWPLICAGTAKFAYDALLLGMFRNIRPPEEEDSATADAR